MDAVTSSMLDSPSTFDYHDMVNGGFKLTVLESTI